MSPFGHRSVTAARNIEILLFAFGRAIEISVVAVVVVEVVALVVVVVVVVTAVHAIMMSKRTYHLDGH